MYFEKTSDRHYALQDLEKDDAEVIEMALVYLRNEKLTDPEEHREDRGRASRIFHAIDSVLDAEKKEEIKTIKNEQ